MKPSQVTDPTARFVPGDRVRHPAAPEWGVGHVQSMIDGRVTVNFEERGKVVVDTAHATLERLAE
jgi:hypothetical protein